MFFGYHVHLLARWTIKRAKLEVHRAGIVVPLLAVVLFAGSSQAQPTASDAEVTAWTQMFFDGATSGEPAPGAAQFAFADSRMNGREIFPLGRALAGFRKVWASKLHLDQNACEYYDVLQLISENEDAAAAFQKYAREWKMETKTSDPTLTMSHIGKISDGIAGFDMTLSGPAYLSGDKLVSEDLINRSDVPVANAVTAASTSPRAAQVGSEFAQVVLAFKNSGADVQSSAQALLLGETIRSSFVDVTKSYFMDEGVGDCSIRFAMVFVGDFGAVQAVRVDVEGVYYVGDPAAGVVIGPFDGAFQMTGKEIAELHPALYGGGVDVFTVLGPKVCVPMAVTVTFPIVPTVPMPPITAPNGPVPVAPAPAWTWGAWTAWSCSSTLIPGTTMRTCDCHRTRDGYRMTWCWTPCTGCRCWLWDNQWARERDDCSWTVPGATACSPPPPPSTCSTRHQIDPP